MHDQAANSSYVSNSPVIRFVDNSQLCLSGSSSERNNSNEEIKKRVRSRRKPRQKPKKPRESEISDISNTNDLSNANPLLSLDWFKIEAVTDHSKGCVIRKRNRFCNCINLESFNVNGAAYIFISKLCRNIVDYENLLNKLNNLNVEEKKSKKENKHKPSTSKQNQPQRTNIKKRVFRESNNVTNKTTNKKAVDTNGEKKKKKRYMLNRKPHLFPDYLSSEEVEQGIADGSLITGHIRINIKNYKSAYVNNENRAVLDYYLPSVEDRNRALEGDEVVLMEKPESEWIDNQKTATVVYILKKVHPRTAVGFLQLMPDKNKQYAIFTPRDSRIPLIRIPNMSWPKDFYRKPELYENVLFMAKIIDWFDTKFALGFITENIGTSGDLKAENTAILMEYGLDITPFDPDVNKYFTLPKVIPEEEFNYREDLRDECIFTIDPLTARDLDDAVSCKRLENGNYEVGVHISDVAFYLDENTVLDQIVSEKATTIYLVDSTYHMLPLELCLYCSLLPGLDKTAFSVIWEMNESGNIINTRFTRSVLNSCAKLAYEHAQAMIENPNSTPDNLPEIHNGYIAQDLSNVVNTLQKIALNLREKRFSNGALRLDQPKLCFELDPQNGKPNNWKVYEIKDAHRLIEEFMLLANISVAKKINEAFPKLAFLRCHEPPLRYMLEEVKHNLDTLGMHLDIESSGGLQSSLWEFCTPDATGQIRMAVLNHLIAKPMTRAIYFCAGSHNLGYKHYALHIPIYTHFTSPIRRYADIMVHRLLAASLGYVEEPNWEIKMVARIADNCNKKKYNSKRAGDASIDLYLAHYVEANQPFIQEAVVSDVKDKSFEVIVLKTGSVLRINSAEFDNTMEWKIVQDKPSAQNNASSSPKKKKLYNAQVTFLADKGIPSVTVSIEMFSVVKVALKRKDKTNRLIGMLVRPIPTFIFESQR